MIYTWISNNSVNNNKLDFMVFLMQYKFKYVLRDIDQKQSSANTTQHNVFSFMVPEK